MKNIYEVLNSAEMNLEEFENQKLSDYERNLAKKQISKELRKTKNRKQAWKKALVAAAACACIIIGMGTISVAAGWLPIPDSFKAALGIHTDKEFELANMMGTSTDIVAVDHGYRVSAEGIIGDGKNMGIIFMVEKSDASPLLDNGKVPTAVEFHINEDDDISGAHGITETIGSNKNANSIEYYVAITYMDNTENTIFLSLEDMQLWVDEEKIDIPGKWEFDIPFEIQDLSVHLAAGEKFEYGNSEGTIDELMVSPIGYAVRVTTADKLSDSDFINMPVELHFKNGETTKLNGGCGPTDNDDGTWSWREDGVYGQMILLDDIKSVVVGDTEFEIK